MKLSKDSILRDPALQFILALYAGLGLGLLLIWLFGWA